MKRFQLKNKTKDFLKSNTEKPETAGPSAEMSQLNRQTVPTTQKKKGCRSVRKVISALFSKLCPCIARKVHGDNTNEKPETAGPSAEMSQLNRQTVPTTLKKKGCRSVRKVISALFSKLCPCIARKVHGDNTNDINVIPPAVTRNNVISSVNKIDTAGGKEIVPTSEKKTEATSSTKHVHTSEKKTEATSSTKHVHTSEIKTEATSSTKHVHTSEIKTEATSSTKHVHTSEIKTEATSGTDSTTSCPCLPRRKYRLGKKCVPPLTTQEEPAEDRPHTSREFVPQVSTPEGKHRLFFGCGKAFLCPPFCCRTKVDTEYEHKNGEKEDVPTLISQAETPSSSPFEKTAPIDRQIEVTATTDIDFDQRSEIVVEPKDGIEISIPMETVSIPESGIEIIAITDHELDQKSTIPSTKTKDIVETLPTLENRTASTTDRTASTTDRTASTTDRTASTTDSTASPDGAVLPKGKISRDDLAHLPIAQEEPEENKSKPREESVQPFQHSSTPTVRDQPVFGKIKSSLLIKVIKDIFKEISRIKSHARDSLTSESFKYYKILGEGHFGRVLLASHPSTDQLLAIKIASKPVWLDLAERQVMEVMEGSRFFPQLFATFQEQDLLFYVMEYVNDWTLKQFMDKRKPLDEDTIRFIAAELLCALRVLHSKDIAHCDLHTNNILLDSSGHVKVIDFGTSKILKHSPCETESPEDFHHRRNALHRDFQFFYNVAIDMSELRDAQTYNKDDDALLDLVKKCEFSFVQLQNHRFFAGINWDEMEAGNISPPYVMEPSAEINRSRQINVKDSMRDLLRKSQFKRLSSEIDGFDFLSERWRDMQQH